MRTVLLDTGVQLSFVLPSRTAGKRKQMMPTLESVNGSAIAFYGQKSLTLGFGLKQAFRWIFEIADIRHPILGANFLENFHLKVNMHSRRHFGSSTRLFAHGVTSKGQVPMCTIVEVKPTPYDAILREFPAVSRPCNVLQAVQQNVTHHILTKVPPVSPRPRRLAPDRLTIAK